MNILNVSKLYSCVLFHFKHHTNHSSARFDVRTAVLKIHFFQVLRFCRLKIELPVFPWSTVSSAFGKKLISNLKEGITKC